MRRLALAILLLAVGIPSTFGLGQQPAKTHDVSLNGHVFTLPLGFEIEQVAGPPMVNRPITADFDEQGRLYVSDSSGTNDNVQIQLTQKPHRVLRMEDNHGDGKFDKRTLYADHLMFPEGTMWLDGSLYVAAPPSIWKLTDQDGDGVVDVRSEWFQGKTLTGCANDLHGPYRGPDGWIYWCKGAFAKQTYEQPGKPKFVTRAAHIFRCRPDGTGIEPVMTGGMDNPVDVVFTPGGERIFTTTFFQHPGGGKRDGLIHAIYGGVYGKDWDPVYEHPWTGPTLMPVLTHLGPAAPCGLVRYESDAFGPDYQDNLFACNFNLHKVTRHVLIPDGATFKTRDEDFLVSNNVDFHPTDVVEDADGSLLVLDTGGWYKLCCPTSQFHKPDVLGAIYRVRRTGAPKLDDPRGLKLDWSSLTAEDLSKLLGDSRPVVRKRAIDALAKKPGAEVVALVPAIIHTSPEARRNFIWAATRMTDPAARSIARQALHDADESVRQVALHSISVWRDAPAVPDVLSVLRSASAHNRRAAAEALGRIGDKAAVPALLQAVGEPCDRALQHSLTYALIEIGDRDALSAGVTSSNPRVRAAALTALDQMPGGTVDVKAVVPELAATDQTLKETAWWIASHHPEWGAQVAGALRDRISAGGLTAAQQDELAGELARFARSPATQKLLADVLNDASASGEARRMAVHAMARAELRQTPEVWINVVAKTLQVGDAESTADAVATARTFRIQKQPTASLVAALRKVIGDAGRAPALRIAALAALPGGPGAIDPEPFDLLLTQIRPDQSVAARGTAAEVLARAKLTTDQLLALADALKTVGPLEAERLLDAFVSCTDDKVGMRVVEVLSASPARASLRGEAIRPRLAKFGPAVQQKANELYAALNADLAKQQARLEQLAGMLQNGDVRRGQAVFHSAKAACSSCHALGYAGGTVGPDLTHIGNIRTERDLLESVVFPSSSFVRSYEPVLVTTKNGKIYNGVLKKDSAEEVVLATSATETVHLARADIDDMQPSKVSIMPAGLDQQLTPQELADLVAFLKACK